MPAVLSALRAGAVRLDLDRLDMLMASYWDEAVGGDLNSANFVLRVIAQRAKYIAPESTSVAVTNQFATLVVGGSEEEYVGALMRARESPRARPPDHRGP